MTLRLMKRIRGLDRHLEAERLLQEALNQQKAINRDAFHLALAMALQAEALEKENRGDHDSDGT